MQQDYVLQSKQVAGNGLRKLKAPLLWDRWGRFIGSTGGVGDLGWWDSKPDMPGVAWPGSRYNVGEGQGNKHAVGSGMAEPVFNEGLKHASAPDSGDVEQNIHSEKHSFGIDSGISVGETVRQLLSQIDATHPLSFYMSNAYLAVQPAS